MNMTPQHGTRHLFLPALLSGVLLSGPVVAEESVDSYLDLGLEDLLSVEVTSVSKKKQRVTEAAAAVFVITQEDIRRSGVTSIPEALRMAPGLQVARLDNYRWAISSRGFNEQYANKLLVLIDGRSVYTPSYSGVFWDVQGTMLEDIDRIEVIRGPGATLWGANAVNGVINIITKSAADTQGGLFVAGAGNEEKGFARLRYGAKLGEATHGRAYIKYSDRDSSFAPFLDQDAGDDWQGLRAGFRLDGALNGSDRWTLLGDIYDTDADQIIRVFPLDPNDPANNPPNPVSPYIDRNVPYDVRADGWNLLGRWEHRLSEQATTTLQLYYDHNYRDDSGLGITYDTLDIDFQHQFRPWEGHDLVWGLGYRRIEDEFDNAFPISLLPDSRTTELFSAFVQDEIELVPDTLRLTLGSKFEHNDYTGFEVQPNARLLWLPKEGHSLWTSVSRAVRTPSRVEDDGLIVINIIPPLPISPPGTPPTIITVVGNEDLKAEELIALELGYRLQPREGLSLDLALFRNKYKNLQTFRALDYVAFPDPSNPLGPPARVPIGLIFSNGERATSYGLELSVDWRPRDWWRLQANYSYIDLSVDSDDGDSGFEDVTGGSSPKHQMSVRSAMDLSEDWSLDLWVYYVDELAATSASIPVAISDYTSLNARLAWRPKKNVELSLVGQNLLDDRHPESTGEIYIVPTEVERSVYGQIRLDF